MNTEYSDSLYPFGIGIRAFYHRYYIPFDRIDDVSVEKKWLNKRLTIVTKIKGVPDYIVASDNNLLDFACFFENRMRSNKAD